MIYLYAIRQHSPHALPAISGLQSRPLEAIRVKGLDAVVSTCDALDQNPTSETLWQHEGVVEALMKDQCVLPVRYGTCLDSEEELIQLIEGRNTSFEADLERLHGCVEVSLRVIDSARTANPKIESGHAQRRVRYTSGIDYLNKRRRLLDAADHQQEKMQAWVDAVHDTLIGVSVTGKIELHTHPLLMTTGAYLLQKTQLHEFQDVLGRLRVRFKEYKFMCTGPWPPYNFVSSLSIN